MLHFVDRMKNIVRRSGENISAAEVEAVLQEHESVAQAAVVAVSDEIREKCWLVSYCWRAWRGRTRLPKNSLIGV